MGNRSFVLLDPFGSAAHLLAGKEITSVVFSLDRMPLASGGDGKVKVWPPKNMSPGAVPEK